MKFFYNRKKEESEIFDAAHDAFITNINHSIRTPMHIILSMCDLIMQESNSDEIIEYAFNARRAGKILQALMNKYYFYSRLRVGSISPMETQFPALKAITGFISATKSECHKKNISFTSDISKKIPNILTGDNLLLTQILFNSSSLATRNDRATFLTEKIEWEEIDDDNGNLLITISCDIGESDVSDIITNNVEYELHMLELITDCMHGKMNLITEGKIKTLNFVLPFEIAKNQEYTEDTKAISYTARKARLLLVDDNELNIHIVTMLLKSTEISMDTVLSGAEALELIQANHYDIMLIDYMMPGMNGIDLLNNIKEKYPDVYEKTPIFALTAAVNTEARDKLLNAGFKGFIPKPVEGNILAYIVKNNLPPELIEKKSDLLGSDSLDKEVFENYSDAIKKYDINLTEGLKYTSYDLDQYATVAEIMVKNYESTRERVETYYKDDNINDLGITVHSLKSNSKFIGAINLPVIALGIELKAEENDKDYITLSLPLLYYEWEKMIKGLKEFLDTYKKSVIFKEDASDNIAVNYDTYLDDIMEFVDNFQPEPAIKLIDEILRRQIADADYDILNKIKEAIENFEYDEAISLLKEKNNVSGTIPTNDN
ncbi:MAG: response regulator [Lachnospiraceae bacterium]|nr:response regulator [Lachnospiraceae bacterium]